MLVTHDTRKDDKAHQEGWQGMITHVRKDDGGTRKDNGRTKIDIQGTMKDDDNCIKKTMSALWWHKSEPLIIAWAKWELSY